MVNGEKIYRQYSPWVPFIVLVVLFVAAGWFASMYNTELQAVILQGGYVGVFIYIFIMTVAIVIAPISAMPLIPIASSIWGWVPTAIFSITGWAIGSQIAFLLARRYGSPFVEKILSLEKVHRIEKRIPQKNLFLSVLFLRMVIPVDILSYALGLFTHMRPWHHFFATLIGITPFAFVFAYLGLLPIEVQLFAVGALVVMIVITLKYVKGREPIEL